MTDEQALTVFWGTLADALNVALATGRDAPHEDKAQADLAALGAVASDAGPEGATMDEATRRGESCGGAA